MNLNNFKKFSFVQRFFILAAFYVITIIAIYFFFTAPAIEKIKTISDAVMMQRIELANNSFESINIPKLEGKLAQADILTSRINDLFINQNRELEFITSLEEIAGANNIEQKINLNMNGAISEGDHKKIPLEILASGNYTNIMNYLQKIGSSQYLIDINSFEFNSASTPVGENNGNNNPGNTDVTIKLSIYTYWR